MAIWMNSQVKRLAGPIAVAAAWGFLGAACAFAAPTGSPGQTDKKISQLIEALGDKDYAVRQRAQEELARLGLGAYEALVAAANHEDLEIASRARYLLRRLEHQWVTEEDLPEVQAILEDYELQPIDQRALRMGRLAALPDLRGIGALCRLVRFERSEALSAFAAVQIMLEEPLDQDSQVRLRRIVKERLAGSSRPGAKWLLAYLRLREEPKAALPEFRRLVEAEQARWQQAPGRLGAELVVSLLYLLAQGAAEQGEHALAEQTAAKAQQMPRTTDLFALNVRMETAAMLGRRGSLAWAGTEYQALMTCGQPGVIISAAIQYAELLHDQGSDLAAAEASQRALNVVEGPQFQGVLQAERLRKQRRARMNYFLACHWQKQNDPARQLHYLQQALQADPTEVDTLIACYRLPNQTVEFRGRVARLIDQAAEQFRSQIRARGKSSDLEPAQQYNQLAWLLGNTERDLDEALRYSQKSLELSPNTSAYLDTLAHVYFARGELENAVKYQTLAVQREPHSRLLNAELQRFRAALHQKAAKAPGEAQAVPEPAAADRKP